MSYPKSLDEYEDEELQAELDRRSWFRNAGMCDYCGHSVLKKPACRMEQRHRNYDKEVDNEPQD